MEYMIGCNPTNLSSSYPGTRLLLRGEKEGRISICKLTFHPISRPFNGNIYEIYLDPFNKNLI
jgi:hypothetical protein